MQQLILIASLVTMILSSIVFGVLISIKNEQTTEKD